MAIVPNLSGVPISPVTPLYDPHNKSFNERLFGTQGRSGVTAIEGRFTANGNSAVFKPISGRACNLQIVGTFDATLTFTRSLDKVNFYPLTINSIPWGIYTGPVSETVWEDPEYDTWFRLECSAFVSGTIDYRISQ